ncbi:MAG: DUF6867 family protein [Pseudomonadota bacterium]
MFDVIYPTGPSGLAVFILVTVLIAGAAAFATGRAIARQWKPMLQLVAYTFLLALVARFLQFALFNQPFLDPRNVGVDFVVLLIIALIGFRMARTRQMAGQYPWKFKAKGPVTWTERGS